MFFARFPVLNSPIYFFISVFRQPNLFFLLAGTHWQLDYGVHGSDEDPARWCCLTNLLNYYPVFILFGYWRCTSTGGVVFASQPEAWKVMSFSFLLSLYVGCYVQIVRRAVMRCSAGSLMDILLLGIQISVV